MSRVDISEFSISFIRMYIIRISLFGAGIGIVKVELTFFVVISENLTNDSVIIMK